MKKLFILGFIFLLWASASYGTGRYKGDLNGDGRVDLADMVYLAKVMKNGTAGQECDINASGNVDDYDLQRLADIIISGVLTEESGLNVGIGGWDDSGEDFGGSVGARTFNTRSSDEIRFYARDPKFEGGDGKNSIEFGITDGSNIPCAILFNIRPPYGLAFDLSKIVELDKTVMTKHKLYGKPALINEDVIRFIIFSSDMDPISTKDGMLGRIFYECGDVFGAMTFEDCQVLVSGGTEVLTLSTHWSDPTSLSKVESLKLIADAPCDIYTSEGILLHKGVSTANIQFLSRGLYIIVQGQTQAKLIR
ncbi:MAG: dockerin type I repeat-containing protein [Prevotella sp.]|nr:dockerin type I repeat-containing protein [Prevotella sp.]